jgi:hypothetical protein
MDQDQRTDEEVEKEINEKRYKDLDTIMKQMPMPWQRMWCEVIHFGGCMCLGCANIAGGLAEMGFAKEEWEEWVKRNPFI